MTDRTWGPGWCLMCQQTGTVIWVGPVEHGGQTAPVFMCAACCERIRRYIAYYVRQQDFQPTR